MTTRRIIGIAAAILGVLLYTATAVAGPKGAPTVKITTPEAKQALCKSVDDLIADQAGLARTLDEANKNPNINPNVGKLAGVVSDRLTNQLVRVELLRTALGCAEDDPE